MPAEVFTEEKQHYEEKKREFLKSAEGRFVLIKGDADYGFFNDAYAAYEEGIRRFGLVPIFIKEVRRQEEEVQVPALVLGVLHADL